MPMISPFLRIVNSHCRIIFSAFSIKPKVKSPMSTMIRREPIAGFSGTQGRPRLFPVLIQNIGRDQPDHPGDPQRD